MSDYTNLEKALRCCIDDNIPCPDCPRFDKCMADRNMSSLFSDAADAIEELSRECKSLYAMFGTHPDPSGELGDLGVLPQPPKEE